MYMVLYPIINLVKNIRIGIFCMNHLSQFHNLDCIEKCTPRNCDAQLGIISAISEILSNDVLDANMVELSQILSKDV